MMHKFNFNNSISILQKQFLNHKTFNNFNWENNFKLVSEFIKYIKLK